MNEFRLLAHWTPSLLTLDRIPCRAPADADAMTRGAAPTVKAFSVLRRHMPLFTEEDEGKTVVNPVGEEVGIVELVKDGTAYVEPHPSWTDRIKASIGWEDDPDMGEQPLEEEYVEEVTDDSVILRQDLQIDQTRDASKSRR